MLDSKGRSLVQGLIEVVAKPLAQKGISPNCITIFGLAIGVASALIYGFLGLGVIAVVFFVMGVRLLRCCRWHHESFNG